MKSLILLLILLSLSPAHAQMSCMDLFHHTRPTEEQINNRISELAYLRSEQYSKDPIVRTFARTESQKKFSELEQYLTKSEIKDRLKNIILNKVENKVEIQRAAGERVMQEISIQNFLSENNSSSTQIIILAVIRNRIDILEALIKLGYDINARGSGNNTALTIAAWEGQTAIVQFLIKNGADINAKDSSDESALQKAKLSQKSNKSEIIELLKKAGATE